MDHLSESERLLLRRAGKTFREIAPLVPCSVASAKRYVARHAADETAREPVEPIDPEVELTRDIRAAKVGSMPRITAIGRLIDYRRNKPPVPPPPSGDEEKPTGVTITVIHPDALARAAG